MKRDLSLIRRILETVEANDYKPTSSLTIHGYDDQTVNFHIGLLQESGYLKVKTVKSLGYGPSMIPECPTWEGYEFLELARNKNAWNKAMAFLKEKSATVSISILTELLKSIVKEELGLNK